VSEFSAMSSGLGDVDMKNVSHFENGAPVYKKPVALPPSREQIWVQAWCAAMHSPELTQPSDLSWWADKCLDHFDRRFPTPGINQPKDE
jgi:hypothetical protein